MIARARRLEDELRRELRAYSYARSDLATACRTALFELRDLDPPDPARAIQALEEVEAQGITEPGWKPTTE